MSRFFVALGFTVLAALVLRDMALDGDLGVTVRALVRSEFPVDGGAR